MKHVGIAFLSAFLFFISCNKRYIRLCENGEISSCFKESKSKTACDSVIINLNKLIIPDTSATILGYIDRLHVYGFVFFRLEGNKYQKEKLEKLYKDMDCLKGKSIRCVMELFCEKSDLELLYKHLNSGSFKEKMTIFDCKVIDFNSFQMVFKDEILTSIAWTGKMDSH